MVSKIAVVGTGTIGHLVRGFLSKGRHGVTIVSQFRRAATETFKEKGITVVFEDDSFTTPVNAVFWEDLTGDKKFDIIMVTGSADFTGDCVKKMLPHAASGDRRTPRNFQQDVPWAREYS